MVFLLFVLPTMFTTQLVTHVIVITLKTREPKKKQIEQYTRKHLFEFNDEIIDSLNKKRKR